MRIRIAILVLLLAACYDDERHTPTDPDFVGALTVTAAPTSIPADGFSRAVITAQISPASASARRSIVFKTTAGKLVGGTNNGADLTVTADSEGFARAELQSSANIETAVVTVTAAALVTHTATVSFVPVDPANVVRLTVPANTVPADGATIVQIYADVAPAIQPRTVQFTTSVGKFPKTGALTADATAGTDGRATIDLQAPSVPSNARITATAAGVTVEKFMSFIDALPDSITVTAPFTIKASETPTVTAKLERRTGVVTAGRVVSFSAVDADGQPVGTFHNVTRSAADGTATAVFQPAGTTRRGLIRLRATTISADGQVITGESTANLVDG